MACHHAYRSHTCSQTHAPCCYAVPEDFYETLKQLTQCGYRVLALGYRELHMAWHHAEKLERCVYVCVCACAC